MKHVIYNYYNILLNDINKDKNNYYFYLNNNLYFFCLVENDINLVNEIYDFCKNNNIECYEIINNSDDNLITNVDGKNYALLKIKGILKYEVKYDEFKYYSIKGKGKNWGELWGQRLDYYEIQLRELGFKYQAVLNSFGVFSGLALNAILYYNLSIKRFNDDAIIAVVHNRLKYPCYLVDYINPLDFTIDYHVRDIAEYIKSYFMSEDYNLNSVIILLDSLNVNNLSFNLLYSRLLYPTFYFDVFDRIILEDGKDNDVINIINKIDDYIFLLKNIYEKYSSRYDMFNVEWINKNVEI